MEISRRDFLKYLGATALISGIFYLFGKAPREVRAVRPPGALVESSFVSVCQRCQKCEDSCPNRAIRLMHITDGFANTGTPQLAGVCISPDRERCRELLGRDYCLTCTMVCPSGALQRIEQREMKVGTAYLNQENCVRCGSCAVGLLNFETGERDEREKCPVGAITWSPAQYPVYHHEICVGCGKCMEVCLKVHEQMGQPGVKAPYRTVDGAIKTKMGVIA